MPHVSSRMSTLTRESRESCSVARQNHSDVDHHLAEVGAALHVLQGRDGFVELEHAVDDWGTARFTVIARFMASNMEREPTKMPWTRTLFMRMGIGLTSPRPESTPIRAMWPPTRTALIDLASVPGAADLDDVVDSGASGERSHRSVPVGRGLVVDEVRRSQILQPGEFLVMTRRAR